MAAIIAALAILVMVVPYPSGKRWNWMLER
jgi:hypothetical protein